jgi:hypothetical protein
MCVIHFRTPLVAVACACLFALVSHAQTPAKTPAKPAVRAPAAATGPFARVPAFPTVCYADNDPFASRIEAAKNAVQAEIDTQTAVNATIEENFKNIDPMEQVTRMQQWMMSNPQEATRYMQAAQSMGQSQDELHALLAEEGKFNEEIQSLPTRYQSALKQAYAPAEARHAALNKKIEAAGQCEGMHEGCHMTDADWAEYDAIQKQRDAAYGATCAQYFGATGLVPAYLKRYRDWLLTKRIPFAQRGADARLSQFAMMNTPAASWKSTDPAERAVKYMSDAESLYRLRDDAPNCTAAGCKRSQ